MNDKEEDSEKEEKIIKIRDTGDNNSEEVTVTRPSISHDNDDDDDGEQRKENQSK